MPIPLEGERGIYAYNKWRRPMQTWATRVTVRGSAMPRPPDFKEVPESPFSHDWERVWEPRDISGGNGATNRAAKYAKPAAYVNNTRQFPETEMQALMEAPPHAVLPSTVEGGQVMKERIGSAIDGLDERLRWVFEARVFRGMSLRQCGAELNLSKTHIARLFEEAQRQLQVLLADLVEES